MNKNKDKKNKLVLVLGVIILLCIIFYLMYYFFVKKSDIYINVSTDKKVDYIVLNGEKQTITTQKYVSDLGYSMRYDINSFKVFKYKEQDVFSYIKQDGYVIMIEKSTMPDFCEESDLNLPLKNCYSNIDEESYYIYNDNNTYKITLKSIDGLQNNEDIRNRVLFMIDTFEIG